MPTDGSQLVNVLDALPGGTISGVYSGSLLPSPRLLRPHLGSAVGGFHYSPDIGDTVVAVRGASGQRYAVGYASDASPSAAVVFPALASPGDSGMFHKSGNKLVLTSGGVAITGGATVTGALSAGATSVSSLTSAGNLSGGSGGVAGSWSVGSLSFGGGGGVSSGGTITASSMQVNGNLTVTGAANLGYGSTLGFGLAASGGTGGWLAAVSNGPTGSDGGYLEFVPATTGNTANRLHITGNATANLAELDLATDVLVVGGAHPVALHPDNGVDANYAGIRADGANLVFYPGTATGGVYAAFDRGSFFQVGNPTSPGLQVRTDNSSADPGMPWTRSAAGFLVINPRVGGDLYLMWDSSATAGTTHVGQNGIAVLKVGEGSGSIYCGQINGSGNIMAHGGYQVVEGSSGSPTHAEHYGPAGSASIGAQSPWGVGFTFTRAYGATPAAAGSCQSTSGNKGVGSGAGVITTTSATIYFYNDDANTQTLSNACIMAFG